MKKIVFINLLLMSVMGFSQSKNYLDQPYYETAATADTLVVPNQIFISINIRESDTKDKISVEKLEQKMYVTLNDIGIDTKKNLHINDMASNYKKYLWRKKDILKDKSYTLLVENAKTLSKVFIRLEKIGISNIQIQKVEHSDFDKIQTLTKLKAIKKAKSEASFLTHSIGQNIGKAIYIADRNYNRSYQEKVNPISLSKVVTSNNDHYEAPDIAFKKIKISSNITIIFELK